MSNEKTKKSFNTTITLREPVTYNEKTYEALEFDFEGLTGGDAINVEDELSALGKIVVPGYSSAYLLRLAAKACKQPVSAEMFEKLPYSDFIKIRTAARNFYQASELQ